MSVTYERRGRVAVITIDRPQRRNAVDRATANALNRAWVEFDSDPEADVAILTGGPDVFSSGADLKSFDLVDGPQGSLGFTRMRVHKPTIAAIEGPCVAGGLEMAIWCDMRVAGRGAVFGCFERRFGVPLVDGGTQRLPRLIGFGLAMELILTGRAVHAPEAHAVGLINAVVDDGTALDTAIGIARRIAGFPQATLRSDRLALLEGLEVSLGQGLELERRRGLGVMDTAERGAARFAGGAGRSGRLVSWAQAASVDPEPVTELEPSPQFQPPDELSHEPSIETIVDTPTEPEPLHLGRSDDSTAAAVEMIWALPPAASGPGLIILSDSGNVDDTSRQAVERLSNAGFLTLGVEVPGLGDGADSQTVGMAIDAAIGRILRHPVVRGDEVGLVGFGLGAGAALWYSTIDTRVRAVVSFAGRMPWRDVLAQYEKSRADYLGHYGDLDPSVDPQFATDLELRLRNRNINATFNVYRGAGDRFYEMDGDEDPDSVAELALRRTISFLSRTL